MKYLYYSGILTVALFMLLLVLVVACGCSLNAPDVNDNNRPRVPDSTYIVPNFYDNYWTKGNIWVTHQLLYTNMYSLGKH